MLSVRESFRGLSASICQWPRGSPSLGPRSLMKLPGGVRGRCWWLRQESSSPRRKLLCEPFGGVNPSTLSSTFLKYRVKPSKSATLHVCPCNVYVRLRAREGAGQSRLFSLRAPRARVGRNALTWCALFFVFLLFTLAICSQLLWPDDRGWLSGDVCPCPRLLE